MTVLGCAAPDTCIDRDIVTYGYRNAASRSCLFRLELISVYMRSRAQTAYWISDRIGIRVSSRVVDGYMALVVVCLWEGASRGRMRETVRTIVVQDRHDCAPCQRLNVLVSKCNG